jgi:anti-anti-sigma factor
MLIEIEKQDDVCILRLIGRFLTGVEIEYLRAKADEVKASNCSMVLADFREVPYIDSMGMGFIVGLYTSVTRSAGGRFVLAGPRKHVREVLDLTKLSTVIPIAADFASGLALLRGEGSK